MLKPGECGGQADAMLVPELDAWESALNHGHEGLAALSSNVNSSSVSKLDPSRRVSQRQLGPANLGTTSIYLQGIDPEEIIATVRTRRAPMMSAVPCGRRSKRPRGACSLRDAGASTSQLPRWLIAPPREG
ncbi:MAG: hypothetical protein ACRDM7_01320 [Thermoleophilaceae bacterium]